MKPNVWRFVKKNDGTYSVFHQGVLLADNIREEDRERQFCVRFGFCSEEDREILRQIEKSGECTLSL
jgi:hypothetical protein